VLGSEKALMEVDRAGHMLVDHAGPLRWASASDQVAEPVVAGQERLAQGPCMLAFAQRAPVAVRDLSAESGWRELAQVRIDEGIRAALCVPIQVGGGPVGTLDIYVATPREWDDSEAAALQTYAGLVASLLAAAVTAEVTGRLADQLQGALEHRLLVEQAVEVLIDREGMDAQAAFEWLRTAARSSECEVVEVAREVVGGAALPSDRLAQAKARRHKATDREVAVHRGDSDLHEGAAQRYERRGDPARAQTERLQAAAARGRITDAEAEQHRADQEPSGS
jgi:GAF domain-containing protein